RLADHQQDVRGYHPTVADDQLAQALETLGELGLRDVPIAADGVLQDGVDRCESARPVADLLGDQPRGAGPEGADQTAVAGRLRHPDRAPAEMLGLMLDGGLD